MHLTPKKNSIKISKRCIWKRKYANQYNVLSYRVDLYFHDYKDAIVVDELGHNDRSIDYEIKKTRSSKKRT